MRFTRIRASRTAVIGTFFIAFALVSSLVFTAVQREDASAQGVSWLSDESSSYLATSSGIPVMVPSWVPGPVSGTTPEIYAGGGSYSIYFQSGSSFLYITGVAGGGFPGGSEANLNVELSVNANVQGWPAIQDIGIPEGSSTPIYDKVMWIADGVFYTVSGNGLDSDSLSLANSSVALYPPAAPVETEPVDEEPVVDEPVYQEPVVERPVSSNTEVSNSPSGETATESAGETTSSDTTSTDNGPDPSTTSTTSTEDGSTGDEPTPTPAGLSDGTGGALLPGEIDPSDGTDGAIPPFLGDDGTGGAP